MSSLQQLYSMVSALNEKFNQIEQNSKRIFELPENEQLTGISKFPISRPLEVGEVTEYTTLNAILEWCIEEIQNIENATRLVQMLPPELLSSPRRIKLPVVDGEENDVPIIWKILGVEYTEDDEQVIEIPDAVEDNYRKDLILGTQLGAVIRFAGTESTEGIIEPIQPENTVLLTSIVVFGNTTYEDPEPPIIGSEFVKKMGYQSISKTSGSPGTLAYPLSEDKRNYVILNWNAPETIAGFTLSPMFGGDTVYNGMYVTIDNQSAHTPTLLDKTNEDALADVTFDFRAGISQYTMKPGELLTFKLRGSVLVFVSTNKAEVDIPTLEDVLDSGNFANQDIEFYDDDYEQIWSGDKDTNYRGMVLGTDNSVELFSKTEDNRSSIGVNELVAEVKSDNEDFKGIVGNEEFDKQGDRKAFAQISDLEDIEVPADQVTYDNTTSGLDATNAQELGDELQGNIEQETTDRQLAIETAGFAQRTGTEIHFDKWATYDSYSSPSDGNYSYDLTNAVIGMVQVSYHEDSVVPTFSQAGIDVIIIGEYQPDIVNRVVFELIGASRILVNIIPM